MYDHLTSMLEVYFSYLSSELNVVMKRLTVVATLAMPAIMIASIYGMNFKVIPGALHEQGFWGIIIFDGGHYRGDGHLDADQEVDVDRPGNARRTPCQISEAR